MFLFLWFFGPETEQQTQFSQVGEAETCMSANDYLAITEQVTHLALVHKFVLKICAN